MMGIVTLLMIRFAVVSVLVICVVGMRVFITRVRLCCVAPAAAQTYRKKKASPTESFL